MRKSMKMKDEAFGSSSNISRRFDQSLSSIIVIINLLLKYQETLLYFCLARRHYIQSISTLRAPASHTLAFGSYLYSFATTKDPGEQRSATPNARTLTSARALSTHHRSPCAAKQLAKIRVLIHYYCHLQLHSSCSTTQLAVMFRNTYDSENTVCECYTTTAVTSMLTLSILCPQSLRKADCIKSNMLSKPSSKGQQQWDYDPTLMLFYLH